MNKFWIGGPESWYHAVILLPNPDRNWKMTMNLCSRMKRCQVSTRINVRLESRTAVSVSFDWNNPPASSMYGKFQWTITLGRLYSVRLLFLFYLHRGSRLSIFITFFLPRKPAPREYLYREYALQTFDIKKIISIWIVADMECRADGKLFTQKKKLGKCADAKLFDTISNKRQRDAQSCNDVYAFLYFARSGGVSRANVFCSPSPKECDPMQITHWGPFIWVDRKLNKVGGGAIQ